MRGSNPTLDRQAQGSPDLWLGVTVRLNKFNPFQFVNFSKRILRNSANSLFPTASLPIIHVLLWVSVSWLMGTGLFHQELAPDYRRTF
jgi:hypothetical protein